MKTIIVACGGGIATSATVASKINDRLKELKLANKAKVEAVDIKSLDSHLPNADLYVSITASKSQNKSYNIPTVNGIPFLTGMGADETMDEIIEKLNV
jgi:PTS system galactitol-specific IIB component